MHSGGAAHLGNPADGFLHLLGSYQHEVGQLVDDHYDLGQGIALSGALYNAVEGFQVPDSGVRHGFVSAHHLGHRPLQGSGGLLRVSHYGNQQVGDAVVNAELHHFGVHHDELDLFRLGLIQQGDDDAVHTHGFTGAGGTGDEHMGQLGNVADDTGTANVFAHGEGGLGLGLCKLGGVNDLPQGHSSHLLVGHLNAHHGDFLRDG